MFSLEKKNNLWSIFGGDITHLKEVICALTTDKLCNNADWEMVAIARIFIQKN
jgi:hypothetical protein